VYEDDAEFIVEVKDGRAAADMEPEFELKNLKIRFDSWKKDFKNRLRCVRLFPPPSSAVVVQLAAKEGEGLGVVPRTSRTPLAVLSPY